MRTVLVVVIVVISTGMGSGVVQADSSPKLEPEEKAALIIEIEEEIERARQEIDVAARELAKLHQKKYAMGHGSNKAMLGVLLEGEKEQPGGVEIIGVTPGGGAAAAGMQAGDSIVAIGGKSLADDPHPRKTLGRVMSEVSPGDSVEVVYMRGGEQVETQIATQVRSVHMLALLDEQLVEQSLGLKDLQVDLQMELGDLGSEIRSALSAPDMALLPVEGELASYFDVDEGVVVREVTSDAEVKPGDVLLRIGDTEVTDIMQAGDLLTGLQDDVAAKVKRHGRERSVTIKPGEFKNASPKVVTKVIRVDDD